MTFEIMHQGFVNGPTERYEFDVPLHTTQGPSWSTDTLVRIAPKFFQSIPRCRAIHPDHDCQCISQIDHRGGWDSSHHCWHNQAWQAWQRGKRDLVRVADERILVKGGVYIHNATGRIHVKSAQVG